MILTTSFFLPDNMVLYFVEFELYKGINPVTLELEEQTDSPNFDDAVILVEVTQTK